MMSIAIAPVVEGHGEVEAVPVLIRRIGSEICGRTNLNVLRPIRVPRTKLVKPLDLRRAVTLADLKLKDVAAERRFILVMFDADDDLACQVGPALLGTIHDERPDLDVALVLAVPEYETWFVAAAPSLTDYLDVIAVEIPSNPEAVGAKKAWVRRYFRGSYTETIEQPALTARMDLNLCRSQSASFDKLCRELEKRFK
jgi:hypothetical protein